MCKKYVSTSDNNNLQSHCETLIHFGTVETWWNHNELNSEHTWSCKTWTWLFAHVILQDLDMTVLHTWSCKTWTWLFAHVILQDLDMTVCTRDLTRLGHDCLYTWSCKTWTWLFVHMILQDLDMTVCTRDLVRLGHDCL